MHPRILLAGQKFIEAGIFSWIFAPVSWLWGFAVFLKNRLYDSRWLLGYQAGRVVVSVGNITAGGTGKTPFVHLLAKSFSHRKVAILSRGYGQMPDEPALLARRLPGVSVFVGKDRAALAKKAVEEGAELLILDDGFQHRRLHRDLDVVLLDGKDPFGKGHYLPWGFLRDSPLRLSQAEAVFVQGEHFKLNVRRILDVCENPIAGIRGWKIGLFCGIAKPASFKKTLIDLGAEAVDEWILADHQWADPKQVADFSDRCKALGAKALVCTEKDFIKLPKKIGASLPILFLEMEMEIIKDRDRWEKLIEKIDQKIDNCLTL